MSRVCPSIPGVSVNRERGGGGEAPKKRHTPGTPGVGCWACARGFCTALPWLCSLDSLMSQPEKPRRTQRAGLPGLTGTAIPMAALGREWGRDGLLACLLRRQEPAAPSSLLGVGHAAPHFLAAAPCSRARPPQPTPPHPTLCPLPRCPPPPQGFLKSHTHSCASVGQVISWANQMAVRHLHTAKPPPTCAFCLLGPDVRSQGVSMGTFWLGVAFPHARLRRATCPPSPWGQAL